MISLIPDEFETQVTDAISAFLIEELPVDRLLPQNASMPQEAGKWAALADMGWFSIGVPEDKGGSGLAMSGQALVLRELGRQAISPAVLGTILAAQLAIHAGNDVLAGEITAATRHVSIGRFRSGGIAALSNSNLHLIDAQAGGLVLLWDDDGMGLLRRDDLLAIQRVDSIDWAVIVERAGCGSISPEIMVMAQDAPFPRIADLLLAAMAVGGAEAAKDMAVAYAKIREQFGQPIGAFQAVKHRCADMLVRTESAWAQIAFAAVRLQERDTDAAFEVRAARILAVDAAIQNAESNIQVHGGIGFTAEAAPHVYVKRAHLLNWLGGDLQQQRSAMIEMRPSHLRRAH